MATAGVLPAALVTDEGLLRGLTRFHALAIVVGAVLGTGIYLRPALVAQQVHSPGRFLAVWVAAALLSLAGALTYAELSTRFPRSGGEYAFLRETLGEFPAFLFGWMRLTVGVGTLAALGAAVGVFVSDLVPMAGAARRVVAALVILALTLLNVSGVARAGRFQSVVTTVKVIGLLGLIGALALAGQRAVGGTHYPAANSAAPSALAWGAALLAALTPFDGWQKAAMVAGEVREARRTLPRALVVGLLITILLYLAINGAYLHVLPFRDIESSSSTIYPDAPSVASRAASVALGASAATALSLLFLLSAVGTLHCNLLLPSRVLFAMARDGLLPASLSRVAESGRTPAIAIGALAALGMTLALLSGYDRLTNMSAFGVWTFSTLSALGLLLFRRRAPLPADAGLFRAPHGVAELFFAGSFALLISLIAAGSVEVLSALALMGVGVPIYGVIRMRRALGSPVSKW
jgi:APA family basic amino acid/polyamine antiporter